MWSEDTSNAFQDVSKIWSQLNLPSAVLDSLNFTGTGLGLPSSFKVGQLAHSTVALSALAAALVHSHRHGSLLPKVSIDLKHACAEFKSAMVYRIDNKAPSSSWGSLGGLHKASDGYVRIHDSFPNHRNAMLDILDLPHTATRQDVTEAVQKWRAMELETAGHENKAAIAALRSYSEWDSLPQAKAISNIPVSVRRLQSSLSKSNFFSRSSSGSRKCLQGLRVLELSRVIAAPLSGRVLAAHGADVLWVTSPNLPDQPGLDRDLARGKRTIRLDFLRSAADREKLLELASTCDVFIQGYRPGSLAGYGFSASELVKRNPGIVYANLSAYGPQGPWSNRRGFDSLVQTCSGMNVSEAEHCNQGEPARLTTCQPLDYGGGYLLATGIMAALYRQAKEGGAYEIDVSLAGVMKHLRSLGHYEGKTGFDCEDITEPEQVKEFLESRSSEFGELRAVTHPANIEGCDIGFDIMPRALGSGTAEWLRQ